jgi:hypothetical protein
MQQKHSRPTLSCLKRIIQNNVMPVVLASLTSVKYSGGNAAQNGVKQRTFVMTPNLKRRVLSRLESERAYD